MSATFPSRCADVSLNVTLPSLSCTNDIMGNLGDLSNFGRGLGSLPSQLGNISSCVGEELRQQIESAIQTFTDTLNTLFNSINVTIPTPLWPNLQVPELEFDIRLRALWQDFKLYLQQQMYNIIKLIPGLGFIVDLINIPIPFLSGIKVFDVFTSEGRARIRAAVSENLDSITEAMGLPWDLTFNGDLGFNLPEMKLELIISRIFSECERLLSGALWSALSIIHTLQPARLISRIWRNLGFPTLPTFSFPSFDEFFSGIWDSIKDLAISTQEKLQRAMDAILDFDLADYLETAFGSILSRLAKFPTQIRQLLSLVDQDWNLTLPEWNFSRVIQSVQTLFNRIPQMILELWLQLIKPFLDAIKGILAGLAPLLDYIPFTMCAFLNLVAAPLFAISGTIQALLPPGINVQPSPS